MEYLISSVSKTTFSSLFRRISTRCYRNWTRNAEIGPGFSWSHFLGFSVGHGFWYRRVDVSRGWNSKIQGCESWSMADFLLCSRLGHKILFLFNFVKLLFFFFRESENWFAIFFYAGCTLSLSAFGESLGRKLPETRLGECDSLHSQYTRGESKAGP